MPPADTHEPEHPLRSHWTVAGRCRMHYRASSGAEEPSHAPVVLVHGFGISSSYFVRLGERLAGEFEVYAPDLPGHGKSDKPPSALDIPQLADALVAWMDAIGLERVALVGNSMGCQVAVDVAVRYPERCDRLVLIGPTADPTVGGVLHHVWRLFIDGFYEPVRLILLLARDYLRMGLRLFSEVRFMLEDRMERKLPQVKVPVLLMRGEKDPIADQQWLERLAEQARHAELAVVPGAGHAVHYSAARQVADIVTPFLNGQSLPR